jgi:Xaa-Pro aminopeptidase
MLKLISIFLLWSIISNVFSQSVFSTFDASFHKNRREILKSQMPANSVIAVFANPIRNRSNDVDFAYHQDPDFYYLTGLREPNAVLLLFSSPQKDAQGNSFTEILFLQDNDSIKELWNGKRLGVKEAKEKLGIQQANASISFNDYVIDFQKFENIFFKPLSQDIKDEATDEGDLFDLIHSFKHKAKIPENFEPTLYELYSFIRNEGIIRGEDGQKLVWNEVKNSPLKLNPFITNYLKAKSKKDLEKAINTIPDTNLDATTLGYWLNTLRSFKTPEEMKLLRRAVQLSCIGQQEAMKAIHPEMSELEIQGIHEFIFRKGGAAFQGYPSIVGAGGNGCVLHYTESSRIKVGSDLVLMDVGAEYQGYTADVTRTVPADGTFSEEQKIIYNIVLEAQEYAFEECKKGKPFFAPHQAAATIIAKRLIEREIIKKWEEFIRYFPHGTSHYLGLDVHDRGNYDTLQVNQVITVEPGIYIPEGSPCDKKWWGIAVRIEDDILITEEGYENLSRFAPRKPEEIEVLMAQPSALDNLIHLKIDE